MIPGKSGARWILVAMAMSMAGPAHSGPADEYAAAQELFGEYRYAAGLVQLRKAAEAGDLSARRTLGLMLLHGETLYGAEVPADRGEALQWLRLAANGGCDVSKYVLARLERSGA